MSNSKEINVMHCLTAVYDGGQETFLVKTFKYIQNNSFNKYNFTICSLSYSTNKELIEKYKRAGIKYYSLNFANRKNSNKDIFRNLAELFRLAKLIKKEKVDILYGHDFFSAFVVRLAYLTSLTFYFYKVKRVYISIHLIFYWFKKPHHLVNKILSYFTDKIICVSQSVCNYSIEHDKINKNKYKVIYNGIDVQEFSFSSNERIIFREEFGINDSTIVIGSVGNISHRKGQKYLIQAFYEVQKKFSDVLVIIIGSCRGVDREYQYKEEMDQMILDLGLKDKIRFYNPRLDINKMLPIFDLFVMPSTVEGFGLALAEAMAAERIVIGSDIPPFKEIIDHGHDGFLFKSGNYKDLKEKIELVLSKNSEELRQIGKNARYKIVNKFNSEMMGREYEKLYNI